MRQRIVRVALSAVCVALLLFAVPLGVLVQHAMFSDERVELERAALQAAIGVGPDFATGDPVEIGPSGSVQIGVYDPALRLRGGHGPMAGDPAVTHALQGTTTDDTSSGMASGTVVVAVPITSGESVIGVVRAAIPARAVWTRVVAAWSVLAGVAAAALTAAILVARRQARALSEPLEQLCQASQQIAGGDLSVRLPPHPIAEIGRVAESQNVMVDRLLEALERERTFSVDASHQLRTPLAGLALGLELSLDRCTSSNYDAKPALVEAAAEVAGLTRTIDDLLGGIRTGPRTWRQSDPIELGQAVGETEDRWHGRLAEQGRALRVRTDPVVACSPVPARVVAQVLDILLDNATTHGVGAVTVEAREAVGGLAIDVGDEGRLTRAPGTRFSRPERPTGHGIGLALGHSLAEAAGGRLGLSRADPTQFSLVLPGNDITEAARPDQNGPTERPSPPHTELRSP